MNKFLVDNYKMGYKWFSTWAFMLIVFLATTPLPPEILNLLPSEKREYLVAIVAVCGMILRFVKQSSPNAGQGGG